MNIHLRKKFFGCIAGSYIGSSMGAATEGLTWQQIKERFGYVNEFLPLKQSAHFTTRTMPPGTTEDGIERQKFMCLAILDKKDRINSWDLVQAWLKYGDIEKMKVNASPFDVELYILAKAGVPSRRLGTFQPINDVVAFPRSCHAIGLINACDPLQAALDAFELGTVYCEDNIHECGLEWGAVVCAAIAEACKPDSTLDSVIEAAKTYCKRMLYPEIATDAPMDFYREARPSVLYEVIDKIDKAVNYAKTSRTIDELRDKIDASFATGGVTFGMSRSPEIVCRGLAIFYFLKADVVEAIKASVNFGRDTDCTAAIAAGLSGAFSGGDAIPEKWIETVDNATMENPYTVAKWTIRELSEKLYEAFLTRISALKKIVDYVENSK